MKCPDCGGRMKKISIDCYDYVESGLDSVVLNNLEGLKCAKCHRELPILPSASVLHRAIAVQLLQKPIILLNDEVEVLRRYFPTIASAATAAGLERTDFLSVIRGKRNFELIQDIRFRLEALPCLGFHDRGSVRQLKGLLCAIGCIQDEVSRYMMISLDAREFYPKRTAL